MKPIYFDHAATTQMPSEVREAMVQFEEGGRGNPYRGLHTFVERSTLAFQDARKTVGEFIGASAEEMLFTKSATEGLNLAILNFTRDLGPGDEVIHTIFDHHATLLPLIEFSRKQGFSLKMLDGPIHGSAPTAFLTTAHDLIGPKTKLVVAPHVSNVTGTILPVKELARLAHALGAKVLIDGAQAVGHMPVNVQEIDCDAYAFSAHKMYGPMGIGALYVREDLMNNWQPLLYGGGMVEEVESRASKVENVRYLDGFRRFEAGTPNVTGAVGFSEACRYVNGIGRENVQKIERDLTAYLIDHLLKMTNVTVFSGSADQIGVISFSVHGVHPHDVAQKLADHGIAVRAGNHCAAPLAQKLHESGTVRVSFGHTNTKEEIDAFIEALRYV